MPVGRKRLLLWHAACGGLPVNESCFRDVLDRREPTRIDLVANPRPLPPNPASDSLAAVLGVGGAWLSAQFLAEDTGPVLDIHMLAGMRVPVAILGHAARHWNLLSRTVARSDPDLRPPSLRREL
jgi:hypothetical protein